MTNTVKYRRIKDNYAYCKGEIVEIDLTHSGNDEIRVVDTKGHWHFYQNLEKVEEKETKKAPVFGVGQEVKNNKGAKGTVICVHKEYCVVETWNDQVNVWKLSTIKQPTETHTYWTIETKTWDDFFRVSVFTDKPIVDRWKSANHSCYSHFKVTEHKTEVPK